jgi:hypothetical protein
MAYFGAQGVKSKMADYLFNRALKALGRGVIREAFQKPAVSSAQAVKSVRIRRHALIDTGHKARVL